MKASFAVRYTSIPGFLESSDNQKFLEYAGFNQWSIISSDPRTFAITEAPQALTAAANLGPSCDNLLLSKRHDCSSIALMLQRLIFPDYPTSF